MTYEEALEYAAVRVRQGDDVVKALLAHILSNHALMREAAHRVHGAADEIADLKVKVALLRNQRDEAERRYAMAVHPSQGGMR